jgi:hypothetical protein
MKRVINYLITQFSVCLRLRKRNNGSEEVFLIKSKNITRNKLSLGIKIYVLTSTFATNDRESFP